MAILVTFISLFGLILYSSSLIRRPFEVSAIFVCSSLIVILYAGGLLGVLYPVARVLLFVGIGLFLKFLWIHRTRLALRSNSNGFLFFLISSTLLGLVTLTQYYSNFSFVDDFSHWARVAKLIVQNGRLLDLSDPVWFHDYPPGTALFVFYFLQLSDFSAAGAMFSQGLFLLAAFVRVIPITIQKFSKTHLFCITLFFFVLAHFSGPGFRTLSVDMLMGLLFGVGLLGYLSDREANCSWLKSFLCVIPIILCLPLVKLTGIFFSFVILGFVFCDQLITNESKRKKIGSLVLILLISISSISVYFSWRSHGDSIRVPKTFVTNFSPSQVINAFDKEKSSSREKETISNFKEAVLMPYKRGTFMPYYWLFVLIASTLFLSRTYSSKEKFYHLKILLLFLFFGFLGYLLILLMLYLFSFGAYEGPKLASIERYLGSYLLGTIVLLLGLSFRNFFINRKEKNLTLFFVVLACLLVLPQTEKALRGIYRTAFPKKGGHVEHVINYANFTVEHSERNARVYYLMQGSDGTENTIFNYGVLPRTTNRGCWSVGEPYFEGDVWTCSKPVSEFHSDFSGYDYLFVAFVDDKFNQNYASLFGNSLKNGQLYKINNHQTKLDFELIATYGGDIFVPKIFLEDSKEPK